MPPTQEINSSINSQQSDHEFTDTPRRQSMNVHMQPLHLKNFKTSLFTNTKLQAYFSLIFSSEFELFNQILLPHFVMKERLFRNQIYQDTPINLDTESQLTRIKNHQEFIKNLYDRFHKAVQNRDKRILNRINSNQNKRSSGQNQIENRTTGRSKEWVKILHNNLKILKSGINA